MKTKTNDFIECPECENGYLKPSRRIIKCTDPNCSNMSINNEELIKEKKEELRKLKELQESMWNDYGSVLSAEFMVRREVELEAEITRIEQSQQQSDHNGV